MRPQFVRASVRARRKSLPCLTKAMRQAGIQPEEIEAFWEEAISAEDRDLLRICGRWVTLVPE
jgi:hypothetical protein